MKVLATFDGSACSESILPHVSWIARVPGVRIVLLSVADAPDQPPPVWDRDTDGSAIIGDEAETEKYLRAIARRLPIGPRYKFLAVSARRAGVAIVETAMREQPDVIVMATHGRTGAVHLLFGDTAEQVVRSGVAPVLLVHPEGVTHARREAAR
jgi:nucleotide-binding universal stress UspA family protein